ncbi:MAG: YbaB/EbfC family nucleoid-associated protein [Alphaproteobacteria bacterium]|nr:YbaB/EbfC family nucleoid-associated protein [Alphaproteobacteria bacterium]
MLNIKDMMQRAQQMQFKLQEVQEKLKDINVEGEAGGGLVKTVLSCAGIVQNITLDPSVINPAERETLEDLIVAALNNANTAKEERIKQETQGMMDQLGLPKDTKLPF